jgi:hypothetical protein
LVGTTTKVVAEIREKGAVTLGIGIDDKMGGEGILRETEYVVFSKNGVKITETFVVVCIGKVRHLTEVDEGPKGRAASVGRVNVGVEKGHERPNGL